jgi:hypothetical protein
MSACPSCRAEGWVGSVCPRCGHRVASGPELELALPPKAAPKPKPAARALADEDAPIELAVDLTYKAPPAPPPPPPPSAPRSDPTSSQARRAMPAEMLAPSSALVDETEEELEARTVADFGPPPRAWYETPLYAYRVLRRQAELKKLLAGRREDALRAEAMAEDALVAMGERARANAGKDPKYATLLGQLKAAEDLVRSRDQALARDQDAQAERIRAIDARVGQLEVEVSKAQAQARNTGDELTAAQTALQRAEAKLKRIEIELRNVPGPRDGAKGGG